MIFVDYAHKPDALASALQALRPMTTGRLVVVFGAGGDRDAGKRPLMGRQPRPMPTSSSSPTTIRAPRIPAAIREAIIAGAPDAIEIGDRGEAIVRAVAMLGPGDVLCIAGKGHETGQIVGKDMTIPFSDHEAVKRGARRGGGMSRPLWTYADFVAAMSGRPLGIKPRGDLRHLDRQPHGRARARRSSPSRATASTGTISSARRSPTGRRRRWSPRSALAGLGRVKQSLTVVGDVLDGLADLGPRGAGAEQGEDRRGHRQRRQDRHQGNAGARPRRRRARCTIRRPRSTITGACR